jgi:hypothetical protein
MPPRAPRATTPKPAFTPAPANKTEFAIRVPNSGRSAWIRRLARRTAYPATARITPAKPGWPMARRTRDWYRRCARRPCSECRRHGEVRTPVRPSPRERGRGIARSAVEGARAVKQFGRCRHNSFVTTGLDPVVHADVRQTKFAVNVSKPSPRMDCRVKPGNDEIEIAFSRRMFSPELCQASPTNKSQNPIFVR